MLENKPSWLKDLKDQPLLMGIVILLKEQSLNLERIVEKLKPSFQLVDQRKKKENLQNQVKDCLQNHKNKLFLFNESSFKWSLNEKGNYFESLEKKIK